MEKDALAERGDEPLFREEVLDARRGQWLGVVRIGRPLSFSVLTAAAVGISGALVAFACWGTVTRKADVHGVLLPVGGLLAVNAPQAGVVAQVFAKEGDTVAAGQPLLRIKSERLISAGDAAALDARALDARRASLQAEQRLAREGLRQRLEALRERQASLEAEEREALSELEAHRLRVQLAARTLDREQKLAREGFVSDVQVQQQQEALLDVQLRERGAQRNLQALRRELQSVSAERASLGNQTQTLQAQLDRDLASLDQEAAELSSRSSLILAAPEGGRVSAFDLGVGQSVQAGQTLLSMVPAAPAGSSVDPAQLQAQLFAPGRAAGFVRPGQTVWLRYAAFPYQKFGMARGRVLAVSRSPIAPQDLPNGQAQALLAAAQVNEPLYRITARLPAQSVMAYGRPTPLAAGMSLDAQVTQDRRAVWEWLLEPALAALGGGRNPNDDTTSSPGG